MVALPFLISPNPFYSLSSSSPSSISTVLFHPSPHFALSITSPKPSFNSRTYISKPLIIPFAITESDNPKSLEPSAQSLLRELAESFNLASDYFAQLPGDLRRDLNDAAFDLSNGPVVDECGQELGETLLNLSRAWEQADTSTSKALVSKFPLLETSLSDDVKKAFGKRLVSAGRRFQSMGQYGQGELGWIADVMIRTGKHLGAMLASEVPVQKPEKVERMFKFGELQVAITSDKANIGAVIGVAFGALSWGLTQGMQSIPESSLQYANDNALLLAKSLRGALLAMGYSSTILSAFASIGLFLLGRDLKSKEQ